MWLASSIQIVWFVAQGHERRASPLFESFFGRRPRQTQSEEIPGPVLTQMETALGEDALGNYRLQIQPGRVDAHFAANMTPGITPHHPPAFSDLGPVEQKALKGAGQLAPKIGDVHRLACVISVFKIVDTEADANREVSILANFSSRGREFSDLHVSVNKRKPFKAMNGFSMNRIMRWAPGAFQYFNFSTQSPIGISTFGGPVTPEAVSTTQVVTLEVDVNVVPNGRVIDQSAHASAVEEMFAEVRALLAHGTAEGLLDG